MPAFYSFPWCLSQCYITEDKHALLCRGFSFVLLFIEQKKLVYNEFCSLSLSVKKP